MGLEISDGLCLTRPCGTAFLDLGWPLSGTNELLPKPALSQPWVQPYHSHLLDIDNTELHSFQSCPCAHLHFHSKTTKVEPSNVFYSRMFSRECCSNAFEGLSQRPHIKEGRGEESGRLDRRLETSLLGPDSLTCQSQQYFYDHMRLYKSLLYYMFMFGDTNH